MSANAQFNTDLCIFKCLTLAGNNKGVTKKEISKH